MTQDIMDIFPDRVIPEPNSGCWLWIAAVASHGYGTFEKNKTAHRYSCELTYGAIPKGMLALHKCDIKICVNPKHIYIGSKKENSADAYSRGRMNNVWHPAGSQHPAAKLNQDQIAEIRSVIGRFKRGQRSEMAARFGVSPATISDVKGGYSWRAA